MIELRWKLEPDMPNKGREDRWTLEYRYMILNVWSDWFEVPYYSPK